jgi:hypothetical protein
MVPSARLLELLGAVRRGRLAEGELPGLLHLLIGHRLTREDGTLVSPGLTWRQAAEALAMAGWKPPPGPPPAIARGRPLTPAGLWFAAVCRAGVDSADARAGAERLARRLREFGYTISAG